MLMILLQACFLPRRLIEVPYISEGLGVLLTVALCGALSMRILDEEEMLRGEFGEEWEKWHKKTARLIPGVF
jgi:protein-S-isoprenylcysteine O-methyltransferase Ste14